MKLLSLMDLQCVHLGKHKNVYVRGIILFMFLYCHEVHCLIS